MHLDGWTRIPLARSLSEHAQAWDALNARYYAGHPMFDSRFIEGLLKHFGRGDEILLRRVQADGAPDGLCIMRPARAGIWETFLPSQAQIAPLLTNPESDLYEIFQALPTLSGQLDLLCQDPDYTPVRQSIARPAYSKHHALTMSVDLDGDFETYWHGRSKNLVANIRRYRNRIEKSGRKARLVRIDAPEAMGAAVGRYGKLESTGWKAEHGTAISPDNAQGAFYGELLERFAETGQASVYEYWIGDRLAASRLLISHGKMIIILKTAFDEALANFSPGRLLLFEVIRDAFARTPGGRIEFYTQATPEQLAWATTYRPIDHHTLFRNKLVDLFAQSLRVAKKSLVSQIKSWPGDTQLPIEFAIKRHDSPEQLPFGHEELFARAETESFDLGLPWFKNYLETIRDPDAKSSIYSEEAYETPVAVLPLRIKTSWLGATAESLANYYTSLYAPILAPQAGSRELRFLLRAISEEQPRLGQMRFSPLDPESRTTTALVNAMRTCGWYSFSYFCFGNWYLPVTGTWEDHLSRLNGQVRNTIKRMGKKFAAENGRLEIVTDQEQLGRAIPAFQSVYAASWKIPEPYPHFMPGLIRTLAEAGSLRMGIAWLGEHPIAAQIWIVNHDKASIYKLAYHEEYSAYSPGTLLTAHLLRHVIDQDKVREVDYLIGDDPYKQSWMTHRRERWGIVAYNPRTLAGLLGLVRECIGRSAKWLRIRIGSQPAGAAGH